MRKNILLSTAAAITISMINAQAEELAQVDVWETEIVSSSINLGKDSIETKQADHLSDLLRDIPGVDVGGSHSMNNKIIIRGIKDEDLNITIDGAKQPNADMFHHQSTLKINPDILKKVNIEVGANSVVHGELGGSIEFETKDGKDFLEDGQKFGGLVSTNFNSNKSIGGSLALFGETSKDSDVFVYYNYIDNDNWETGEGVEEKGRDGEIDNILVKYGVNLSDTQRLTLSYDKLKDEGDYLPRPNFSSAVNAAIGRGDVHPTKYIRDTYTIKHSLDNSDKIRLNTSVYMNKMDLTRIENDTNRRGNVLEALIENKGINSKAQSSIEAGDLLHTFTYGLQYDVQSSDVDADGSAYGKDEEAKSLALFVEDKIDFDNGLLFTPGLRFNNYKLDGVPGKINDNKLTYSLAAEYEVNENLTLLASHTTLFKGVPMQEVFSSYRTFVKENSNLKSQTGTNNEVGFKYIEDGILGADTVGFSFKYFKTDIKNDLGYDSSYDLINLGETQSKGIESTFAYNINDFSSLLTYSKVNTEQKDTGKPLDNEVGDSFSLSLKYLLNPEVQLSWKSILVLKEDDVENVTKKGYNVHDLALRYTPTSVKGLKVIAGVDNIFDKSYASHSSHHGAVRTFGDGTDSEPGRNVKVTLSYKF